MKKLTLAIALAALVIFAGCKKDKEITGTTLKASIEQHRGDGSKTSLNPDGAILWSAGDKIVVNNGSMSGTFTLTSGQGTKNGIFTYNGEYTFGDSNIAVYPETATISGNNVTVTLPAEKTLAVPGIGMNPMLSTFTDPDDLLFTSLCGALGISLKGTDIAITAVEVVSKLNETLNGEFTSTTTDATLNVAATDDPTMQKVRLNCATTLTAEAQTFYFALPVGALSGGFTLNVYGEGADPIYTKGTTNDITIELNQVNQMPAFTVDNIIDGSCGDITILGGTVNASSQTSAGIGASLSNTSFCGNITISGANVTARGGSGAASIGSATSNGNCGNITISDATVVTTNQYAPVGIGGGMSSTCGDIAISNSNITATGASSCIGGGSSVTCGNITISGCTVVATNNNAFASIGIASSGSCGDITINDSDITATGYYVGIGSGPSAYCGNIDINGGTISATARYAAIGALGSGSNQNCGNISIHNATVTATATYTNGTGIGIHVNGTIGDITIYDDVVSVTAVKGGSGFSCIGKGNPDANPTIGTITVGGTVYPDGADANQTDNVTFVYPQP